MMRRPERTLIFRRSLRRQTVEVCNVGPEKKTGSVIRKLRSDRGSSLVEFSVSASVLFFVLFGIIEMSFALYIYDYVSDAARVGTRYAMVRGTGCMGTLSGCGATQTQIQTYLQGLAYPGVNSSSLAATVQWYQLNTSGATGWSTACSCPSPENEVRVTVTYPFPLHIPYFPSSTINIHSTSQMVISN